MDRAGMYRIRKYILDLVWTPYTALSIPPERWCPVIRASILHGGQHWGLGIVVSITNANKAPVSVAAKSWALNSASRCHSHQPSLICVFLRTAFWWVAGRAPPSRWHEGALWTAAAIVQNLYYRCTKLNHRHGNDLFQVWKSEASISCWWAVTSLGDEHAVRQMTRKKVTL